MVSARAALVLFSCVVLYSVQYASAMKCYTCMSKRDADQGCFANPKNDKYLLECSVPQGSRDDTRFNGLSNQTDMTNIMIRTFKDDPLAEGYECATIEGKMKSINASVVMRGCMAKSVECNSAEETLRRDVIFDSCKKCTGEGCNSSDAMKAGIWSLIVSLAMLSYFKF